MVEIVIAVAAKVAEYLVAPIARPFRYICTYKTNFEILETEVRKLNCRRNTVQHLVEASRRNGEEIEQLVYSWIDSAKKINDEASLVIQENQQANTECLSGWCSNPKKRHKHSRKAEKKVKDVVEVYLEGDFHRVSYRTIPKETWLIPSSMKGYEAFESRMSTSKDILHELSNPDVNMVGVYGQSGIGKTTLVKEVSRQPKVKELFDQIVYVEVSKTPDIKKIQEDIADKLGLQLRKEIESDRAWELCARLKKENKILLILEDIWERLDLDKVGIPFEEDHKGCKLLLTSTNEDILKNKMESQSNFPIGVLNEEEAWSLFKKIVGNCIEDGNLDSIAKDVAKACGGVPIVIVTKARELKNKGECEWKNALVELRKPSSKSFLPNHSRGDSASPFNSWIDSAKKIDDEASPVIQENQQANTECLKKVKDVVEVYGEGDFQRVSYRTIPEETWHPSLKKEYEAFESRMSTSIGILRALSDPDVNMVGVYGDGGIGKTMLVKEVSRQPKVKELFDRIVFVEVSTTPDIKKIQGEIADKLGLQLSEESESGRARALRARLKNENKILLILDDICGRLDLDKVGIPFEEDHKGCKLLLTSTNQNVLTDKLDSQRNFHIDVLSEEEAWSLFKKTYGSSIEGSNLDPIAKDVVKACGGVPKVIVTTARKLQIKEENEWKNALGVLRMPSLKGDCGLKFRFGRCRY